MKQLFRNIALLFLSAFLLAACNLAPHRRVQAVLDDVESYINDRPDSALAILRALPQDEVRGHEQRARTALLHSIALDKCYVDLKTDSILAPAVSWYERHGSPDKKMKSLYYLGRIQFNAGDYEMAGLSFLKAYHLFDSVTDNRYKGLVCQHLANVYNRTYNYSESLSYTEKAYAFFKEGGYADQETFTLHRLAEEYLNNQQWDQAKWAFDTLMSEELPVVIKQDALCGWALYFARSPEDDYSRAVEIYSSVLSEFGSLHTLNDWGCYAYCLAMNGNNQESERIFEALSQRESPDKDVFYYGWRSLAEKHLGNYFKAWDYYTLATEISNKRLREALEQSVVKAQRNYFESESQRTKQQAKISFYSLALLLLTLFLAGIVLYLLYKRHLVTVREERERMYQLSELAQQSLHLSESEVSSLRAELIRQKKTQFVELGKLSEEYCLLDRKSDRDKLILSKVSGIIREISEEEPLFLNFENKVNKAYDNVMLHFRSDFPSLPEKEYRFVCFLFAGFDTVTIMILLRFKSKEVVYSKKARIRKEIRSSASQYKDTFLQLLG